LIELIKLDHWVSYNADHVIILVIVATANRVYLKISLITPTNEVKYLPRFLCNRDVAPVV